MLHPGPALRLAGCALLHLHLWSGTMLVQQFDITIVPSASDTSRQEMMLGGRWAMLSPTPERSWVWLTPILGWPGVNAKFCTQPEDSMDFYTVDPGSIVFRTMWDLGTSGRLYLKIWDTPLNRLSPDPLVRATSPLVHSTQTVRAAIHQVATLVSGRASHRLCLTMFRMVD